MEYERKVLRKDGRTSKTMSFQSRPDVIKWDATPEEQEAYRARAFEMAWQHVARAPCTEETSPFGKGLIFRREAGERFWYHGRVTNGYKFNTHAKGPVERKVISVWEPGIDTTLTPRDFCTNCTYCYSIDANQEVWRCDGHENPRLDEERSG